MQFAACCSEHSLPLFLPQKRAYYDRTGYESSSAAAAASGVQNNRGGSGAQRGRQQDEFNAEEIFEMFFG